MAFPKNRSAFCPLSEAPSPVDSSQLMELGLTAAVSNGTGKLDFGKPGQKDIPPLKRKKTHKISKKEVKHVAKLARLRLDDSESRSIQKDLNAVLAHFETLQDLDTENVRPMSHVLQMKNVWREDKPAKARESDRLLSNAPEREDDLFKVPKILEG